MEILPEVVPRKKRGKDMDEIQCGGVVTSRRLGTSIKAICKTYKKSKSAILKILRKYREDGVLGRRKGGGRKRKTTAHHDRMILREVKKDRRITGEEVRESVGLGVVCERTVRRRITESKQFKSYWASKKPYISKINRKRRLAWCKRHQFVNVGDWGRMLFSDESPYVLIFNEKVRVWRMHNERYNPACTVATLKHDKKINVWGCFAAVGTGHLHLVDGIMEQQQYREILEEHMLTSAEELFPDGAWYFQQDNDPKHTANLTKKWFVDNNIPLLEWPSQSPDLNPIENLWSILNHRMKDRKPQNEKELFEVLQEGWRSIPQDVLQRLADSMPRRIAAVIKAKGYATKY
jgi:transposase